MVEKKKTVVIAGPVTTRSGYGSHARDIARALIYSEEFDVAIVPIRWGNTPQNALDHEKPEDRVIIDRIIRGQLNYQPDIFIHVTIPNEFQRAGKVNVGFTAGIETDRCRVEWIQGVNKMDYTIVTSQHSKSVFDNVTYEKKDPQTGMVSEIVYTKRPIEVLFEGVDLNIYGKPIAPESQVAKYMKSEVKEKFCFLFVGHWLQGDFGHDRKDVGRMIHTFLETFKDIEGEKPALILKTSLAGFSTMEYLQLERRIQDIRNMIKGKNPDIDLPNVYVLHGDLTDQEMNDLYKDTKVKAMVSFTKGEGFGRPLLEFTTTGKPVLASGWSGQVDFLHKDHSILLPGSLTDVHPSAQNEWIIEGSKWFTVDYNTASYILRDCFINYSRYLKVSKVHKRYTSNNFSFKKMSEKLCEVLHNSEFYVNKPDKHIQVPEFKELKLPDMGSVGKVVKLPKLKKV